MRKFSLVLAAAVMAVGLAVSGGAWAESVRVKDEQLDVTIIMEGEIINIGSDHTYSVNRLVDLLCGDVVHIPKRPGEPNCTWADIAKAKKLLNWQPKVSLEEGVGILLDNIDYWREAPVWDEKSIAKATEKWFEYLS